MASAFCSTCLKVCELVAAIPGFFEVYECPGCHARTAYMGAECLEAREARDRVEKLIEAHTGRKAGQ